MNTKDSQNERESTNDPNRYRKVSSLRAETELSCDNDRRLAAANNEKPSTFLAEKATNLRRGHKPE